MTKKLEKKLLEIDSKRIPLRQLLHGKEIRDAAKALEDFRLKLNDKEILYGAKILIKWDNYGDVYAVARRLETDKEFADRIEKARLAAEAKKEREAKRKLQAEIRAREEEATRKQRAADYIKRVAKEAGLSVDILDS
jgi:hypothetical protein